LQVDTADYKPDIHVFHKINDAPIVILSQQSKCLQSTSQAHVATVDEYTNSIILAKVCNHSQCTLLQQGQQVLQSWQVILSSNFFILYCEFHFPTFLPTTCEVHAQ